MQFLRDRELRIKVANTKNENKTPTTDEFVDPEKLKNIEETAKRVVKTIVVTVGVTVLAIKTVGILGEIAVKKTRSGDAPEN
jgi:lipopolysaccharide/colanic/teichoic acid biosynthesis glycosyltransferase